MSPERGRSDHSFSGSSGYAPLEVFGGSAFSKLLALVAVVVAASVVLVAFRSAGGSGDCVTAYRTPPSNGRDATCNPDVTIGGVMLWNFEGLLYKSLGDLPALKEPNEQSPNFVSGYQVCQKCTFYSYTFANHTNSAFKLVAQGPKRSARHHEGTPRPNPRPVRALRRRTQVVPRVVSAYTQLRTQLQPGVRHGDISRLRQCSRMSPDERGRLPYAPCAITVSRHPFLGSFSELKPNQIPPSVAS